jgi:hypothetical protein
MGHSFRGVNSILASIVRRKGIIFCKAGAKKMRWDANEPVGSELRMGLRPTHMDETVSFDGVGGDTPENQ